MSIEPRFGRPEEYHKYPTLGGGEHYDPDQFDDNHERYPDGPRIHPEDAEVAAGSAEELREILTSTAEGDIIWLENGTTIDPGKKVFRIHTDGVVIAGGRGLTDDYAVVDGADYPTLAFHIPAGIENVRLTSFGLTAPETKRWELKDRGMDSIYGGDKDYVTTGISVDGPYTEIDNIAASGWGHAAIEVGRHAYPNWLNIHHCDLVDTPTPSLGYGVVVFHGFPRIHFCYFDNNRHSVAGDGAPDCNYRVMNNLFGPHTRGHILDMHSGHEVSSKWPAKGGRQLHIHNNIILATRNSDPDGNPTTPQEAIAIRNPPAEGGTIEYNKFAHAHFPKTLKGDKKAGEPIRVNNALTFAEAGLKVQNNVWGYNVIDVDKIGIQPDVPHPTPPESVQEPVADTGPDPLPIDEPSPSDDSDTDADTSSTVLATFAARVIRRLFSSKSRSQHADSEASDGTPK